MTNAAAMRCLRFWHGREGTQIARKRWSMVTGEPWRGGAQSSSSARFNSLCSRRAGALRSVVTGVLAESLGPFWGLFDIDAIQIETLREPQKWVVFRLSRRKT